MATALRDIGRITVNIPALLMRTIKALRDLIRHRKEGGPRPAVPFTGPATSFNGALTANRSFVTGSVSLDQIKRVKNAHSTTLNDVLLAVVAGALRRYLNERSELPDRPLVAGVPVSTRTGQEDAANRVSNLFVTLPVDEADPVAQLRAVHLSTTGAKAQYNVLGADMLADWSELTPGRPYNAVLRWYSGKNLADRTPSPINLVVSNVPGPREPRYLAGALITELYSMGPILEGVGLNLTMWSYLDRLYAGVVACPEALGDLRRLVELLPEALDDLEAATPAAVPS